MIRPVPPTQDEIERVAAHWERVRALACTHPEITFHGPQEPPTCSECQRPVQFLSDIQVEEIRCHDT